MLASRRQAVSGIIRKERGGGTLERRALVTAGPVLAALATLTAAGQPARIPTPEHVEARVVLIDTIVTGEGGRPVPGLTKDHFTLRIDGKNAAIAAFEDHCRAATSSEGPAPAAPIEGESADAAPLPADPHRTILYFDLPHLSSHGAARSVRAARRHIEAAGTEGNAYMVVAYGPDVRILTNFTTDRGRILAALARVTQPGVLYDDGPVARSEKIQEVTHETCLPMLIDSFTKQCPPQVSKARDFARDEELVARGSLDALRATLVALESIPGRKALLFFTETLRDEPGVYYLAIAKTTPGREQISIAPELKAVVEEANAGSISFYPVHAAGLDDESETEVGRTVTSIGTNAEMSDLGDMPGGTPQQEADVGPIAAAQRSADEAALGFNVSIAAETGGRHLGRTNDLSLIFPIVREESPCYYVLSHAPAGAEDGKRHAIAVGVDGRKIAVRSRPFYVDYGPDEKDERRLKTALAAPGAFQDIGVKLEAFALGRSKPGREVLVEASISPGDLARAIAGIPPDDGIAILRLVGHVTDKQRELCSFNADFSTAEIAAAAARGASLHYEAACSLPPGPSEISAALPERKSGSLGAARREIGVPAISGFHVSEAQLWASSTGDLVYRDQAREIFGATKGIARNVATPRVERRLRPGERGSLLFFICPPGNRREYGPLVVTRALLAGETAVATFAPLQLADPPDPASGCWQISSDLPPKVLGEGFYTFRYEVTVPGSVEPISKSADLAVGEAPPP